MATKTVASIPTALLAFEGLDRPRRKRIEAFLRRLVGLADAAGWALALFNSEGELREYDLSGSGVGTGRALSLLCTVPFPYTPGPVALRAEQSSENARPVIAVASPAGAGRSVALILLPTANPRQDSSEATDEIQSLARQIAHELSDVANRDGERRVHHVRRNGFQAFFLLDRALKVEQAWRSPEVGSNEYAELVEPREQRLPAILERAVRRLTAGWNFSRAGTCVAGTAFPLPNLTIKVTPMTGTGSETFVGILLEQCADSHAFDRIAVAYRISPRERDVLHALLDGDSVAEIASALNLAESTVNDHIARMIAKTSSRNRIEMAALFLGWPDIRGIASSSSRDESPVNGRVRCSWRYNLAATPMGNEPVD